MLRYLIILAVGGVYSDADTRAVMPLRHWADGAEVYPLPAPTAEGEEPHEAQVHLQYPVRMIISIEGDFHIWRDKVAL